MHKNQEYFSYTPVFQAIGEQGEQPEPTQIYDPAATRLVKNSFMDGKFEPQKMGIASASIT